MLVEVFHWKNYPFRNKHNSLLSAFKKKERYFLPILKYRVAVLSIE
ncbi:MAG: hypothetical protein K940chlam9_01255 [Chlamydiae bacterium]|nr:hypothetical protein [Chlamydiota bacterium]